MSARRNLAVSALVSSAAMVTFFFGLNTGTALAEDTHWGTGNNIVVAGDPECPQDTHWSHDLQTCVEDTHW